MEKPSHIKFALRSFTADEAEKLLEESPNWRLIRVSYRDQLAETMAAGNWEWQNGETIAFDENEKLVNGQHRLSAAVVYMRRCSVARVWFWCALGVHRKTQFSMDQGLTRKVTSYLSNEGVKNVGVVAAILTADAICKNHKLDGAAGANYLPIVNGGTTLGGDQIHRRYTPTTGTLIDIWRRNKGAVIEWAEIGAKLGRAGISRPQTLAAIGYQLAKRKETEAKLFFSYLEDGAGLKAGDPILMLRERLRDEATARKKSSREAIAAITIKAWNAWMEGDRVGLLRYNGFGPRAEEFPAVSMGA